MLAPQQMLILEQLCRGSLDSGELFRRYREACKNSGEQPVVDRTFRNYLGKLVKLGLLRSEGDGRWRRYSLVHGVGIPSDMPGSKSKPVS